MQRIIGPRHRVPLKCHASSHLSRHPRAPGVYVVPLPCNIPRHGRPCRVSLVEVLHAPDAQLRPVAVEGMLGDRS